MAPIPQPTKADSVRLAPRWSAQLDQLRNSWWSDDNFDTWKQLYLTEYPRGYYVQRLLADYAPEFRVDGASILDIGCGDAGQPIAFAESGARAAGLEIDTAAVERGRLRAEEHGVEVDLREGIAEDLPWSDGTQDLVLLDNVLEHVQDPWKTLMEIHRVLRPDGLLYCVTPKPLCLYSLWNDPHYDLAGLVLLPRALQKWYFERIRGAGEGAYDVEHIPTRLRLRMLFRAAGYEPVVSPRELWIYYLRNRIRNTDQIRTAWKRRLAERIRDTRWLYENPIPRWFFDIAMGSNMFLLRKLPPRSQG